MSSIHPLRRLPLFVGLLGFMALMPGGAHALTAGTGTVDVTVVINAITKTGTLTIAATFADATYDLGVNLGSVKTVSASTVAVTNLDLATGASFVIPFANTGNSFDAAGDIACPSGGCAVPASGPYAFVGFLDPDNLNVSALPAGNTYTFDGSVTCTLSGSIPATLTCSGPFVLNAFPNDTVGTGNPTINRSVTFRDPTTGATRNFNARVTLTGVTSGGPLNVAGLSRYRGTIPTGYALSSGNFRALYFDVATDAVFSSGRVCVEVDVSPTDGIVDGTSPPLTLNQLAILHASSAGNPFSAVPLILTIPGFVCADALTSLSPFVVLVDTTPPSTTSTTLPPATTTTTTSPIPTTTSTSLPGATTTSTVTLPPASTTTVTTPVPTTTSTSLPPPCQTARDCLTEATAEPLCTDTISAKLQTTITKNVNVARTKLGQAASATSSKKAAKFQKQAKAAITVIGTKANAFAKKKKGGISTSCRDAIRSAFQPVLGAIEGGRF